MGKQAESRAILGHMINVSMPFSKENRVWALICNATELSEDFNPDTEDKQYICDTTKTKTLKGYDISLEIEMDYQKDNKIQDYYNIMLRTMPIGADTQTEYIRFNKDETMFGTSNQFIGVRRDASVYLNTIGGAGDDVLKNSMTLNGNGQGEVGYVKVINTGNIITYEWVPANTLIPYVSKIGGISMSGYYPGVTVNLSGEKLSIEGIGGISGATVEALFESTVGDISGNTAQVGADGKWLMDITGLTKGKAYNFAFKQTSSGEDSVTTKMMSVNISAD